MESGSNFIWFSCWGALKINLLLEWGSKFASYQCWGLNSLGNVWGVEIDLVSGMKTEIDIFFVPR